MGKMTVEDYLNLPYTIEVIRDESGGFFAKVLELPGCMTQAENFTELAEMIHDAMAAWIETALADGDTVPLPRQIEDYSGKFIVRLPKSLHRDLTLLAKEEGVSLNAFVSHTLAQAAARKRQTQHNRHLAA